MAKGSDKLTYILGILILGFVAWQLIGYILPDNKEYKNGDALLDAVIKNSGGFERWDSIKSLQFEKEFGLYAANGATEIARKEAHDYTLSNGTQRMISWHQDSTPTLLKQDGTTYTKYVNKIIDSTTSSESIKTSIQAGSFVIGLPFTLKDANAKLVYQGVQQFQDQNAYLLQVEYANSQDVWKLYYEEKSLNWLGYWVKTTDHYRLIVNEE